MMVVLIIIVVTAIAIPSMTGLTRLFRIASDARSIAAQLNTARMRAAADFSHGRLYMDLAHNTYQLQVWNKSSSCWVANTDPTNTCITYTSSAPSGEVTNLSTGMSFGYGSLTTGPTSATSTIAQAPACTTGVAGSSPGSTNSNTACIEYGSRTYPVDSTNKLISSDAIYITNGDAYAAIAVPISGQPQTFRYSGSAWVQF
jgi:Tfp pilus assembly protein FimT